MKKSKDLKDTEALSDEQAVSPKISFLKELQELINKHNKENASNTPDFILAQYLEGCLAVFVTATQQRETWHGRDARPTHIKDFMNHKKPIVHLT